MGRRDLHVVPCAEGWAVRKDGAKQPASIHRTQKEAIAAARDSLRHGATHEKRALVVHGRDGQVRDSISYGGPPLPSRDEHGEERLHGMTLQETRARSRAADTRGVTASMGRGSR